MNVLSAFKKIGGGLIKQFCPAAGGIIDGINELLPNDKKISPNSTGDEAIAAIESLPAEQRALVYAKQLDVEIEEIRGWSNVVNSLADADKAGASTRPKIALIMAHLVGFVIIIFVSVWATAMVKEATEALRAMSDAWPMIAVVLGTPTALLRAYFGMRSGEKKARYESATGAPVAGGLAKIIKAFK